MIYTVIDQRSMANILALILFFITIFISFSLSYGYDPLDPSGNITITWDFISDNGATVDVKVSIYNLQVFRHVEAPGWRMGWAWKGDEVIWEMWGAEAMEQGNCSKFKGQEKPHCCLKHPLIIDLPPNAPYNHRFFNCCRGGLLSSLTQDITKSAASFQLNYNKPTTLQDPTNTTSFTMPDNFSLGVPGYTCSSPFQVPPTKFTTDGHRWQQVLETWNVTCMYSQYRASPAPKCCVSLSAFYNSTIVPCPVCSCNCKGLPGAHCIDPEESSLSSVLQLPQEKSREVVRCSRHMCPIRIHWHVKQSYKEYWRVKITITNLNLVKNYSQWNLVVLHPNLRSVTQVFSFNYKALPIYGNINDTGMFWGLEYYNDMLLSGKDGNVQTEMLLHKDKEEFTFREGWTFPRKVSFNGEECVMPSPDNYPRLPSKAHLLTFSPFLLTSLYFLLII